MNCDLQIPNMREELCDWMVSLSDLEHQKNVWHDKNPAHEMDNFENIIHFIYDDTNLSRDPKSLIGVFLKNLDEAQAVNQLVSAIDGVLDQHSRRVTDAEYIVSPGWSAVLSAAQMLRRMICPAQSAAGNE